MTSCDAGLGPFYVFNTSLLAYFHPFYAFLENSDLFFTLLCLQEEMSSSAQSGEGAWRMGGSLWGRTEQDRQRKKERWSLQPSVRLAGIQTTAHQAQAHASLPLSAIVAQRRRTQTTGPRNRTQKKHTPTAEHKRTLVLVNRARNMISAGGKLLRDKEIC